MQYSNFKYRLQAGFTTETGTTNAIEELNGHSTVLLTDDGDDMRIAISAGSTGKSGYFTLLTDTKILIKRVSLGSTVSDDKHVLTTTYTNLKLPDFQRPSKLYVAGKVYYLYQATGGPTHSIGSNTTHTFKIKYKTHETKRELTYENIIYTLVSTENNPRQLKANKVYSYANSAYTANHNEYLQLPKLPHVGDVIEINLVAGPTAAQPRGDSHFRFLPPADGSTINGNADDTNHQIEADSIRCTWTDNPSIGWLILSTTHRP